MLCRKTFYNSRARARCQVLPLGNLAAQEPEPLCAVLPRVPTLSSSQAEPAGTTTLALGEQHDTVKT